MDEESDLLELVIGEVRVGPLQDGYHPVKLFTSRGHIECRYYPAPDANRAAVFVGGVGGDWDTPANGLYPRLCVELADQGIASLRVKFRHPTDLAESVLDALAGIAFLQREGIEKLALIGHSFGGAVVIQAAAACRCARTVITLSTQSYGTAPISQLGTRCSVLLIHGSADNALSPGNSESVYRFAKEPKRLIILKGARHGLDEASEEVYQVVCDWIVTELSKDELEQAAS